MNTQHAACPRCGSPDPQPVSFTWWGGAVGPRLFHHVRCRACKSEYNGRTGLPNTTAIVLYQVFGFVILVVAYFLLSRIGVVPAFW